MFTIVCLGDSITCNWDSPSYVDYWQELLDQKYGLNQVKIISAGVNGETAQDGYYRLNTDVLPHHPDLVTVMFGHNDVYLGVSPQTYERYLDNSLHVLSRAGIKHLWLLSPNQVFGGEKYELPYQPYLRKLNQVAADHQVTIVDLWRHAFKNQDPSRIYTFQFDYAGLTGTDYVHPNEKGHRLLAQYLMDHFIQTNLVANH